MKRFEVTIDESGRQLDRGYRTTVIQGSRRLVPE